MAAVKSADEWSRLRKMQTLPGRVDGLQCLEKPEVGAIPDVYPWKSILGNILKLYMEYK